MEENLLKYKSFIDFHEQSDSSGKLNIAENSKEIKYLVKRNSMDAANEFTAHNLTNLIGMPTSDAVLHKRPENIENLKQPLFAPFSGKVDFIKGSSTHNSIW